jgi:ADP-ribosylglycohydrolase
VFVGGDTDTIACMAGATSCAFLGAAAIPAGWLGAVREQIYTVERIQELADQLLAKHQRGDYRGRRGR